MSVAIQYRGKGIGKVLLREVRAEAKKNGIERIELKVYASNVAALKLIESYGFVIEGIKRKARKFENSYEDIIDMGRII